jgi:predicted nuclease with TOPRIM domain
MVKEIIKRIIKGPIKDTIKVYRGEYLPGKNPSEGFKQKGEYFDNIKEKLKDIDLTPDEYANKLNKSEGRYFSTKKDIAKIFSKGEKGRVVEAEISKKDLELGKKLKEKFFKLGEDGGSPDTLLIPKKNLKDVKENIDSLYEKLGTAGMEYKSGGLVKKGFPKLARKGWK